MSQFEERSSRYKLGLRKGLVGDKYQLLYNTSATFHHSIDALVEVFDIMVSGIACSAEVQRDAERIKYDELTKELPKMVVRKEDLGKFGE